MIGSLTERETKRGIRKSKMFLGEVYFWTDTIKDWKNLLKDDVYKDIMIGCWRELIKRKKIILYGFVIMPNHTHVLWELIDKNGKEMPHASFNKYTAHLFLEHLRMEYMRLDIPAYREMTPERNHRFWRRDAKAMIIEAEDNVVRVLDYIHDNPLQDHWRLVTRPEDYRWSSAKFYETGIDEFGILTHYKERF